LDNFNVSGFFLRRLNGLFVVDFLYTGVVTPFCGILVHVYCARFCDTPNPLRYTDWPVFPISILVLAHQLKRCLGIMG
jgi:hypothetical protein